MSDDSYFDMTPQEEADLNVRNALKLNRSREAWREACLLAQVHDKKTGLYAPIDNYALLDIFNRMMTDFLRIDNKA